MHHLLVTHQIDTDIAELERRHRMHAPIEDHIRTAQDTGLRNVSFNDIVRASTAPTT